MQTYQLYSINGPVVTVRGRTALSMREMVYVGRERLVGEVIRLDETDRRPAFGYAGSRHPAQYL